MSKCQNVFHSQRVIADWRDSSQYQFPQRMSAPAWAWEFLRRNPDYQADYRTYLQCLLRVVPDAEIDTKTASCTLSDAQLDLVETSESMCRYEPERHDGENEQDWLLRVNKGSATPLDSWLGRKWGIERIVSPYIKYRRLDIRFEKSSVTVSQVFAAWGGFGDRSKMALAFDLTMPIAQQIEAAERWLLSAQRTRSEKGEFTAPASVRMHADKYPLYLRTFDAVTSGATREEIAAELAPDASNEYPDFTGNKTIANRYNAAERMVKSDYRQLPQHSRRKTQKVKTK